MKKRTLTLIIFTSTLLLSSCWNRIGKLVVVSTRNMDSKTDYVLIQKEVTGKAKTKNSEAIEEAIDNAVKKYPTGEFMKNVVIQAKFSGKKIKVVGDVWGTPPINTSEKVDKTVTKSVSANISFNTGDRVTFKNMLGKLIEGKIIGVNQNTAIIEEPDGSKTEVKYEKLTKIEK